ncbi:MAG: TraX family protein [Lachnospiraceae bacterium]
MIEKFRAKIELSSFTLKIIAIVSMTIDHVGVVLFPQYIVFRIIGRIAFPIFCFLLVEGFFHTHDLKKYMLRLGIFALVSEIPFDLAASKTILEFQHQNIFFTLLAGAFMLYLLEKNRYNSFIKVSTVVMMMLLVELLHTDYSSMGLLIILCFYLTRGSFWPMVLSIAIVNILFIGHIQGYGALALIPIGLYSGEQGPRMKYFFYCFYPIHLLLIYLIWRCI